MAPPRSPRGSFLRDSLPDPLDGFLDDLISIESPRGGGGSGPGSPDSASTGGGSSPTHWRLSNPVHMEIQENARLPTFNWPVDRTGSSSTPSRARLNSDADAANRPTASSRSGRGGGGRGGGDDGGEMSLAEIFLSSPQRQSFHASYQQAGALRKDAATDIHIPSLEPTMPQRRESLTAAIQEDQLDLLAASVEPTPLSEIRRKHSERHQHYGYSSYFSSGSNYAALPIPQRTTPPRSDENPRREPSSSTPPPTESMATAGAVATAAEIASRIANSTAPSQDDASAPQANSGSRPGAFSSVHLHQPPKLSRPNSNGSSKAPPGTFRGISPVPISTSDTTTGALQRASQQRTQYGFGPKHVVPSVPAPPRATGSKKQRGNRRAASTSPNDGASSPTDSLTQGQAYERKKQRAKVARVKLNESIERLSIAINLAGTQSKQRQLQWQSLPSSQNREQSLDIMDECMHIAENAKKWDRPSFVGAAASLVQGLNTQCEHLMRELVACHEREQQQEQQKQQYNGAANGRHSDGKRSAASTPGMYNLGGGESSAKRARMDESPTDLTRRQQREDDIDLPEDSSIFGEKHVAYRVASFLDPPSLVRCFAVSKVWRRAFSRQESWQDMALERFGHYNVRQWKGKLEDEDEGIACSPVTLYRSMDAANVMPHVSHDGVFLLGEARLQGKVSAWTFLVERSNGETLRSVKRPKSMPGTGEYASLPVVELRTIVQNTGSADHPVVVREQTQSVDASTRRRGVEMVEIDWDSRFQKRVLNLDGSERPAVAAPGLDVHSILCQLKLFEAVVIETFIHAKGCSTTSKFVQKSNFTQVLVQLRNGTTVPLVIPFPRDISHHLEH